MVNLALVVAILLELISQIVKKAAVTSDTYLIASADGRVALKSVF